MPRCFCEEIRDPIITDEEVAIVKAGMQQYCRLERFIIDVKKNAIIIYTPDQDVDLLVDTLDSLRRHEEARAQKQLWKSF